jgi:hypothetical protein
VYVEANVDLSTAHCWAWWISKLEKAHKLHEKSRSGGPSTAAMPNSIQYVDELICDECCKTTDELQV